MPTPVGANPKRRRFMPWTLTIAALAMLMAGCNPPYPMLKDADRASVSDATIRVGETFTVYATADSGSEFPFNYAWSSSDPDVVGFESREELGAYSQRAVVIGRAPGTAVVTYGQFASGGQPGERSDSMTFTVQPSTPTLTLEPSAAGWVSTPESDLSGFSSVQLQLEFSVGELPSEINVEFAGSGSEADELEVSTRIANSMDVTVLSATFDAFPSGIVESGDTLIWNVTVDLTSWPSGATRLAVRPLTKDGGTVLANYLTLQSSTLTVTP